MMNKKIFIFIFTGYTLCISSQQSLAETVFSDGTSYGWGQIKHTPPELSYNSSKIADGIKAIQSSRDIDDVNRTWLALKQSSQRMIQQREQSIRSAIYNRSGVSGLELQTQNDRRLDERYYSQQGKPYLGPTTESMETIQMLDAQKRSADQQINAAILNDGEIREINQQVIQLDNAASKRISELGGR